MKIGQVSNQSKEFKNKPYKSYNKIIKEIRVPNSLKIQSVKHIHIMKCFITVLSVNKLYVLNVY